MTRDDLKDYKHNQEWIKGRLEYIEEYKTSITNITSVISDMPRGSKEVQDSMAEKVVTLLDNVEELVSRIIKEQEKQKLIYEVERCEKMLSNPGFVNKAPEVKVNAEKEKLEKYKAMLENTEERLKNL